MELIFKNSPLFTPNRKQLISVTINSFHGYLEMIGFEIPKIIPPIGTFPGKCLVFVGVFPFDPILNQKIDLPEDEIDNPSIWLRAYAGYVFRNLVDTHSASSKESHICTSWTSGIFTEYFISSYLNQPPKESKGFNGCINVLWDIRNSCGQYFTDQSLYYASRSDGIYAGDFNKYFMNRLRTGINVIDNNFSEASKVQAILKKHSMP